MQKKIEQGRQLSQSLSYAWKGLIYVFVHEQNFRIQVAVGGIVVALMLWLPLGTIESVVLMLLIMGVLVLEIFNSVVEKFVDIVKPRLTYQVKIVKDMMAAAVLILSIGTSIIGLLIFMPHIIEIFVQ